MCAITVPNNSSVVFPVDMVLVKYSVVSLDMPYKKIKLKTFYEFI